MNVNITEIKIVNFSTAITLFIFAHYFRTRCIIIYHWRKRRKIFYWCVISNGNIHVDVTKSVVFLYPSMVRPKNQDKSQRDFVF